MIADTRRVTWIALSALAAGLLAGAALASAHFAYLEQLVDVLEPIGAIWVNAVRMTVVPLVVSLLIVAVASSDTLRAMGRLGGAALLYFLGLLIVVGILTFLLATMAFPGEVTMIPAEPKRS